MKRKILVYLMLIPTLIACLLLVVNAHPGKTDSNGGHYDHDAGEYHYHHGYSAHSHYDANGDGIVDCPYDFDDQTDHSSAEHSRENYAQSTDPRLQGNDISKKGTFLDVLKVLLKYLFPAVLIGTLASHLLSYLIFLIWGNDKGCSITFISFVTLSIIAYILLIILHFRN